jgi:hypothetical protein
MLEAATQRELPPLHLRKHKSTLLALVSSINRTRFVRDHGRLQGGAIATQKRDPGVIDGLAFLSEASPVHPLGSSDPCHPVVPPAIARR